MKYLSCICMFVFWFSCSSGQNTTIKNLEKNITNNCPDDGVCSFSVIKKKSLNIKKDGIGSIYPEVVSGNNIILKFEYKRNEIPNTQDSHYIEQVFIEIEPNQIDLNISDNKLQLVKLLYARLCFCRGQTGYYKINKGNLILKKVSKNTYEFELTFITDEVPQIITRIKESFTL